MNLTHRETEALDVLCDTFVPSLAFTKDEDPALFSMSAADLGVSGRVAEALDRIEPAKSEAFRLFSSQPYRRTPPDFRGSRCLRGSGCCNDWRAASCRSCAQHTRARGVS